MKLQHARSRLPGVATAQLRWLRGCGSDSRSDSGPVLIRIARLTGALRRLLQREAECRFVLQTATRRLAAAVPKLGSGGAAAARAASSVALVVLLLLPLAPALAADEDAEELPFGRAAVREYVLGRLSEMAGRELEVTGDIDIDLAWTPSMRLEGVRVANAEWGRASHLLEIEALELELDMRALMEGDVRLPRLALIRPTLFLELSEDGEANWILGGERQTVVESAAAPGGKLGALPQIDRLEVKGGELAYLDHGDADAHWVRGQIDDVRGRLDDQSVDIGVSGSLGNERFTVVLRTASLADLRAGNEPNRLFLLATSGPSRLLVEGTAVAPFELRGIDLKVQAHGAGFDQLPLLTNLPKSPPFELDARLRRETAAWRLDPLTATIGRSQMQGEIAFDPSGQRPRLSADLNAKTLVVDELLALMPDQQPGAAQRAEPETPEQPDTVEEGIDLSALTALDADVRAEAQRLDFHQLTLNQAVVRVLVADGVLTLMPVSAAVGGGRVGADLTLTTDPVAGQARVEIDAVDLSEALDGAADVPADEALGVLEGRLLVALPPADPSRQRMEAPVLDPETALQRLRVPEGRLSYHQPQAQTELTLTIAADPTERRPNLGVDGRFRGYPVAGELSADPLPALISDQRYAAQGRLRWGGAEATFDARLLAAPSLQQLRIDFDAGGALEPLEDSTGISLPATGQVAGQLRREGATWTLSDLDAQVGASDLAGRVRVDLARERPQLDLDLQSETLDLAALMPPPAEPSERQADDDPALNALSAVDGEIDYQADQIITEGAEIADLALQLQLHGGRMRLGPSRLELRRPAEQTALGVRLAPAQQRQGLAGEIQGRFRGESLAAELYTEGWVDLAEDESSGRWELRASPADTQLRLSGQLRDLLSPSRLSLDLSARGSNAARLSTLVGMELPRTPPFQLRLALTRDGGRFILEDIDAMLGDSDIDGRIAIDTDNVPTAVNVELASDRLDLDDLLELLDQRPKVEPKLLFPDRPLGLDKLGGSVQGQLSYQAAQVVAANVPLSDVSLEARLRDRRLQLEPLRIGVGGGDLRLGLDLDTAADPPTADLDGKVRRVNLRQALAAYPIADESLGLLGGELRLWMSGDSPAQLVGSADGGLFLVMTGGVFEQLLVEVAGLDVGEAGLALLDGDQVPINCGYLNLRARDGQVEVETLAVDTRDSLFVGGGEIDLDRQRLDLVIEARPKDPSLPTFSSPLRLRGPLKDPQLTLVSAELVGRTVAALSLAAVQPLAALLPLIETGGGGSSWRCDGLMERLQEGYRQ